MASTIRTRRARFLRILLFWGTCSFTIWLLYHLQVIPKYRGYDDSIPHIQRFNSAACSEWQACNVSVPVVRSSRHDPQWHKVIEHVFVYSAFISEKHPPNRTVDIIAIVQVLNDQFLEGQACWCRFLGKSGEEVEAEIRVVNERHLDRHAARGVQHGSVHFICDIPDNTLTTSVTVQCRSPTACASVQLPLHQIPEKLPKPLTFALCHAVLYGGVSAHRLIEFIEYYKLLGIDKLIFYKHDVQPEVQRVLEHYRVDGIVDVYTWMIPGINMTNTSKEVHYLEQTAALNDCTERTGFGWDYTLQVDLDEFLVINRGKPLSALVRNGFDDCVSIRSTMMKPPPLGSNNSLHQPLSTLLKFSTRQSYIWPPLMRSKAVCRGRKVLDAGIHFPHFMLPGVRYEGARGVRTADPDTEAVLFHMRKKLIDYAWWWKWVTDERGLRYVEPLVVNMDRVIRKLLV